MEDVLETLNYQPVVMLDSDLENPLPAMTYFFVNHPLDETRTQLWDFFKGWLHLAAESPDGRELEHMLFFYEQLVEMINLCYVFTESAKQKRQEPE